MRFVGACVQRAGTSVDDRWSPPANDGGCYREAGVGLAVTCLARPGSLGLAALGQWALIDDPPAHCAGTAERSGQRELTGSREALGDVGPVDDVPDRFDEAGPIVLVLEVVGVFPGVDHQERDAALAD